MLTSKQRAYLRGVSNDFDTIFQIGKGGIGDELILQLGRALDARELIKIRTLETCELSVKEAADTVSKALGADVVGIKGSRIVLYRESENKKYSPVMSSL